MSDLVGEFIAFFFLGSSSICDRMEVIRREAGLNDLSLLASLHTSVWLTNLDVPWTEMLDFVPRDSQTVQWLVWKLVLLKYPEPFLLSSH